MNPPPITATSNAELLSGLPELSDDEEQRIVAAAIRSARIEKANIAARADYARRLNEPVYRPGAEELGQWLLTESANPQSERYIGPNGLIVDSDEVRARPTTEGRMPWTDALEQQYIMFWALCLYFTRDVRFEELPYTYPQFAGLSFSLDKSLALFGPVGCGKTTLMELFVRNPAESYAFVRCPDIETLYVSTAPNMGGETSLLPFVGPGEIYAPLWRDRLGGWCFDDLGTETVPAYHFKNAKNIMQWILDKRYTGRRSEGMGKTHLTTNLSGNQIEQFYGQRIRDRLRETANVLKFSPKTPSWRI